MSERGGAVARRATRSVELGGDHTPPYAWGARVGVNTPRAAVVIIHGRRTPATQARQAHRNPTACGTPPAVGGGDALALGPKRHGSVIS